MGGTSHVDGRAVHVVDVLVYVVVLNLTVEYAPEVLVETFTVSLLTAALLKLVLELVVRVKERVVGRVRAARSVADRVLGLLLLVLVLPGSKLAVLWVVDVVFGEAVHLGGFVPVTVLVVVLLLARLGVRRLLDAGAGPRPAGEHGAPRPPRG